MKPPRLNAKGETQILCPNDRSPMRKEASYCWRCALCELVLDVSFKLPDSRKELS